MEKIEMVHGQESSLVVVAASLCILIKFSLRVWRNRLIVPCRQP
jgi:hypothetical protein